MHGDTHVRVQWSPRDHRLRHGRRRRSGGDVDLTIANAVPTVSIDSVTKAEGNAGTTSFTFTVSLSAIATRAVDWHTSDGTATTVDHDYTTGNGR